jgi:hypothetical protein
MRVGCEIVRGKRGQRFEQGQSLKSYYQTGGVRSGCWFVNMF